VFPEVPLVPGILGNPGYRHRRFPASLGILGRLEHLAVPQYLASLGNLELLEHPAILGILEHLANLRYLGVPGNLGSLECLGFLERLEYRRQRFPANLGIPDCLEHLAVLASPAFPEFRRPLMFLEVPGILESLGVLEVPAILGIPERPESRLRQ
jgi:hypothetical protein